LTQQVITDAADLPAIVFPRLGKDFAFDVETTGLNPRKDKLCGLALTFSDESCFYIVIQHTRSREDDNVVVLEQHISTAQFIQYLQPLFAQEEVTMVAHNAKFDLHFLSAIGLKVRGRLADTMLAAQLINENREVGLKDLASSVGVQQQHYQSMVDYPGYGKNEFLGVNLANASNYAMKDTLATWRLWQKFRVQLVEEGVDHVFRDVWMPLLITLQQMEAKGISLDLDKVTEAREHYLKVAAEHEHKVSMEGLRMIQQRYPEEVPAKYLTPVEQVYPDVDVENESFIQLSDDIRLPIIRKTNKAYRPRTLHFKAGSNDHLGELIYDHYGLTLPSHLRIKQTQNGKTVSKDALDVLVHELGDDAPPVLKSIVKWRKAEKFIGTYLDRFLEDADRNDNNTIRTSFNQHVTDTGRLSSSGPNLQNIPSRGEEGRQARDMFIARPGHKLVVADYSMMELRMLAHYSQDSNLLSAFIEGKDLHILTGAQQAGMDYDELKIKIDDGDPQAKQLRSIGKTSNFGLTYGMGAKKYQLLLLTQNGVEVTEKEAQRLIDAYNNTFTGATLWKKKVVQYAQKLGYVQTMLGRKRRLPGLYGNDRYEVMRAERMGINAIIQGSCSDVISQAMPAIQKALSAINGYILLQVHDELVCEVPEQYAETGKMIVGELMVALANPKLRCPLIADAHVGNTWGEAKG
jgi:DNA polymerase-1